jgi:hypothetical protein
LVCFISTTNLSLPYEKLNFKSQKYSKMLDSLQSQSAQISVKLTLPAGGKNHFFSTKRSQFSCPDQKFHISIEFIINFGFAIPKQSV